MSCKHIHKDAPLNSVCGDCKMTKTKVVQSIKKHNPISYKVLFNTSPDALDNIINHVMFIMGED